VREALRLMKGRDDLARLRADVQAGCDEVARGEGIEYTPDIRTVREPYRRD
jgi:hypothetical protein